MSVNIYNKTDNSLTNIAGAYNNPINDSASSSDTTYSSTKIENTVATKIDKTSLATAWSATTTDTNVPSEKLVKDSLDAKVDDTQIVSSFSATTLDTNIPSEKLVKTKIDAVEGIVSHENLIDNPWFTINQRAVTTSNTTKSYPADRWMHWIDIGTITTSSDGIVIDATSNAVTLSQLQEVTMYNNFLKGKTVTQSVLYTLESGNKFQIMWHHKSSTTDKVYNSKVISTVGTNLIATNTFTMDDKGVATRFSPFWIYVPKGNKVTIRAVKLEIGSTSTLANDTAPNKALELTKCQRFYQKFNNCYAVGHLMSGGTSGYVAVTLPTTLRSAPKITVSGYGTAIGTSGAVGNATFVYNSMSAQQLYFNTTTATSIGDVNTIYMVADVHFEASADIEE